MWSQLVQYTHAVRELKPQSSVTVTVDYLVLKEGLYELRGVLQDAYSQQRYFIRDAFQVFALEGKNDAFC
jgi:hypothetical protein